MIKMLVGLIVGLVLGTVVTLTAAPRITGTNGWLWGWTVEDEDGDEICSDPYVWLRLRTIECD